MVVVLPPIIFISNYIVDPAIPNAISGSVKSSVPACLSTCEAVTSLPVSYFFSLMMSFIPTLTKIKHSTIIKLKNG